MSLAGGFDTNARMKKAHQFSSGHRKQVLASGVCGCFYCGKTFAPTAIEEWIDDDQTALCPKCGVDSVIGDASGEPVTDASFLGQMFRYWFY